jgi:hypothetical protein
VAANSISTTFAVVMSVHIMNYAPKWYDTCIQNNILQDLYHSQLYDIDEKCIFTINANTMYEDIMYNT